MESIYSQNLEIERTLEVMWFHFLHCTESSFAAILKEFDGMQFLQKLYNLTRGSHPRSHQIQPLK